MQLQLPITFRQSIPAGYRQAFFSVRIKGTLYVERVAATFAENTQRLLRVRFFVAPDTSTRIVGTNKVTPAAPMPILGLSGDQDWLSGDGLEGPISRLIRRRFPEGMYLCCEAENIDSYAHTLDAVVEAIEER